MPKLKAHILTIVLYVVGLLAALALFLLLEQPFLLAFLAVFFVLPAVLLPLFFASFRKVSMRSYCPAAYVEKGNRIPLFVEVINPTLCPFFLTDLSFTVNNLYHPNEFEHMVSLHVLPRKNEKVQIPLETSFIGMAQVNFTEIAFTDPLHFFRYIVPLGQKTEVPVFPPETIKEDLPATPAADGIDEYTESDAKGNISSDIKEIRLYQPGDRLQRIHWKLSAKLDDLFVKEMAHTSILSLVLLPELTDENIEETVSTLRGCIKVLLQREERFEVCLYHHGIVDFNFMPVTDDASTMEALIRLYYLPLYKEKSAAKRAYFNSGVKQATVISIRGEEVEIISDY